MVRKSCAFPQHFHTRKLDGISLFYAVTLADYPISHHGPIKHLYIKKNLAILFLVAIKHPKVYF